MLRKYTKRIPNFKKPNLEEYDFGNDPYWFPGLNDGLPGEEIPYDKINAMWNELYYWIVEIIRKNRRRKECLEYTLGEKILPYVEARDAFGTKLSIKYAAEDFDKAFHIEDMPQEAKDLLEILMYDHPKYFDLIMSDATFYESERLGNYNVVELFYASMFS